MRERTKKNVCKHSFCLFPKKFSEGKNETTHIENQFEIGMYVMA